MASRRKHRTVKHTKGHHKEKTVVAQLGLRAGPVCVRSLAPLEKTRGFEMTPTGEVHAAFQTDPLLPLSTPRTEMCEPPPSRCNAPRAASPESGMLSREQRLTAVPQLIDDSDDPALDSQTHAWAFQALTDITKQHLPNDSIAWRDWYQKSVASGG